MAETSLYDAAGGMPFFVALVDAFYDGVAADPEFLAIYPHPDDLGPAREHLTLFLAQYWGGPTTYSDERGHPRLRMRHMPFVIGAPERDRWLLHIARRRRRRRPPRRHRQGAARLLHHGRRRHAQRGVTCRSLPGGYESRRRPDRVDVDAVHRYLAGESYWAAGREHRVVADLIASAHRVVGLYGGGELVGFCRAVSDGVTFAYLADVYVLDAHRGDGRGLALVEEMVARDRWPACGGSCGPPTPTACTPGSASRRRRPRRWNARRLPSADERAERPQGGEEPDDRHHKAPADWCPAQLALLGPRRGPQQRQQVPDEEGPAQGEHEEREQVVAQEHRVGERHGAPSCPAAAAGLTRPRTVTPATSRRPRGPSR